MSQKAAGSRKTVKNAPSQPFLYTFVRLFEIWGFEGLSQAGMFVVLTVRLQDYLCLERMKDLKEHYFSSEAKNG
eukprot:1076995-Amphidinium_carterae.1